MNEIVSVCFLTSFIDIPISDVRHVKAIANVLSDSSCEQVRLLGDDTYLVLVPFGVIFVDIFAAKQDLTRVWIVVFFNQ